MKYLILYILFICLLGCKSDVQTACEWDKIDSTAIRHMNDMHIPGLALAIVKNKKVEKVAYYGFSNLESGTPVDQNTRFEIASMTKQFTCAAILLLQEDGKLSVKDKLFMYLPDLSPSWKAISIEQLMNHTSGLRDDWDEPTSYFLINNSNEKMSLAQQTHPLLFEPGTGFQYSSGPFFLGLVIEKITGRNYAEFLKERIFNKLGMHNTTVFNPGLASIAMARGYYWKEGAYTEGAQLPIAAESRADVGLVTTLEDMIKWSLALTDNRLLKSESINYMFSPGKLKTGEAIPYGAGWYIYFFRDQLIYEHGGAFRTGFNSRISRLPDSKTDIIILSNKWQANLSDLTYELAAFCDSNFRRVSELEFSKVEQNARDAQIRDLLFDLSIRKYSNGELYRQINVSGFDVKELEDLLKDFEGIECLGKKYYAAQPLKLFYSNLAEIYYYRVFARANTIWAFAFNDKGELICANLED